jgi:hypothetical protein
MINGENAKLGHCLCRSRGIFNPSRCKKVGPLDFFLGELYHQSTLVFQKKNSEISSNFYHPDISPLKLAIFLGYSNAVATGD